MLGLYLKFYHLNKLLQPRYELSNDVWLCGHRGKSTVRCMMAKSERLHLLRILGLPVDDTELKNSKSKYFIDKVSCFILEL